MDKEMTLYLATGTLSRSEYTDREEEIEHVAFTRLVWAASAQEAEEKIHKTYDSKDPYGTYVYVLDVSCTEAIT